ncbi:MAG TPA: YARHG domain-containing protein [Chitinophagaceae bacterium]|nr:YARHG domain-containing protein [Chitinophagaceae bacterium]
MRKFLFLLLAGSLLNACNNNKKNDKEAKDSIGSASVTVAPAVNLLEKLLGSFVGAFGDNKITMLIIKAEGDSVLGRSIVGGNDRPFAGTFTEKDGIYSIVAKEPGDHKDDGVFTIYMNKDSTDIVKGFWKANDKERPFAKAYTLQRKKFEYKTDVGNYPESSQRLLRADDVENLPKRELEFMRNEIFARHGFCFKKKNLRQEFEMQDWYVPNTVDIKGFLTDVEKKNIALLKRYEKYADDYGDEYGR